MKGDERTRFCEACGLHVHNLSAMTAEAAAKCVAGGGGRVCVSFERTSDGGVRTLDYERIAKPRRRGIWVLMSVVGAILIGRADAALLNRRPAPTLGRPVLRLTGVVLPPVSPTTLPSTQPAQTQPASAEERRG
jgi:hypothetical protein